MKKIKKTREEKEEIKKFRREQRELRRKLKIKKKIKKENIFIAIAIIVLIILVSILFYFIFFNKKRNLIVPDTPTYESLEVGIVDSSQSGSEVNDLNSVSTQTLDVSYQIISDYYEKGILLSNTQVYYLNDSFMITSGALSSDTFISKVTKEGKLEWINKLKSNDYDELDVYKVVFGNDNYYIAGISSKNNTDNLIVLKISEDGSISNSSVIANAIDTKIKDVLVYNEYMAIITNDGTNTNIYLINNNLELSENVINLNDSIEAYDYISYCSGTFLNNNISIISKANGNYLMSEINIDTYVVNTYDLSDLNELSGVSVGDYLDGFLAYSNTKLFKYNSNNKLTSTYDYESITLENDTEYKEKYKDNEYIDVDEFENSIFIENVNVTADYIMVNSRTLFSSIYDIYDENLNLSKRVIIDMLKYSYEDGVKLNSFYIDGAIYEIYSYGTETPSIMISRIG